MPITLSQRDKEKSIVIVSIIGYASLSKKANTFIENQKIFLSTKATNLDEVVIIATKKKELTAKEIESNYPTEPYI